MVGPFHTPVGDHTRLLLGILPAMLTVGGAGVRLAGPFRRRLRIGRQRSHSDLVGASSLGFSWGG
jgi:hypothetical protein